MRHFPWPRPRRRLTIAHMMNAVALSALTFWIGSWAGTWYLTAAERRDPVARLLVQAIPAIITGFSALLDAPIAVNSPRNRLPPRP